ncbi:MAG: response regulator transcription factor [Elusimicrobiota bacterium]
MVLTGQRKTIIVVDDEPAMIKLIDKILQPHNYFVVAAYDAQSAIAKYNQMSEIDLAIVDILLPDLSGIEVLRHMRGRDDKLPIIMISALNKAGPAISCLQMGASDYIIKPFTPEELVAKVSKALNTKKHRKKNWRKVFKSDDILMDISERTLTVCGKQLELTSKEYNLLQIFLRFPNKFINRNHIIQEIWGDEFGSGSRTLDAHIYSLRKKLGKAGERIVTIKGEGYKFIEL